MNPIPQADLVKTIGILQRLHCADDRMKFVGIIAKKPATCSCRKGYDPPQSGRAVNGTQTACPDLALAAALLAELLPAEFSRLVKRAKITEREGITFPERQAEKERDDD